MTRKVTNRILEALEDGALPWESVARECLAYMPEDDVEDMNRVAEFVSLDSDDEEEDELEEEEVD